MDDGGFYRRETADDTPATQSETLTKHIVEFYVERDTIRWRKLEPIQVTREMIECGTPTIDLYYEDAGFRQAVPPSLLGHVTTIEVLNRNFCILWDRHCDELGVPTGTTIHLH